METSGANAAIRATLDIASHAGRIALTGWPKQETPLPTEKLPDRGGQAGTGKKY